MEKKVLTKENLKIVFFGTPEFAVASLDKLLKAGYNVAAVVTMPDKVAGRGHKIIQSDIKKYAVGHNLQVLQPERLKSEEFVNTLKEINADLFVVIAFRMLPEVVWSMPPLGTFNLHGSLLPKYRGAAPINRAIMNGETETGVTTFFLKHEIDTGDIIGRERIEITDKDNAGTVHDRLMELGADMVLKTVGDIIAGTLTTTPQPEGEFIPAPKIFKEDCRINWSGTAAEIRNQVRGLSPYPAAFSTLEDETGKAGDVKILTAIKTGRKSGGTPGSISVEGKSMFVDTADELLEITELQPAGKRRMAAADYLLGHNPLRFID